MPVTFESLIVGQSYDRPELARLWGYAAWHAIGRGVVTPSGQNIIILFITKEKQESLHQYADKIVDDCLYMDGESNHANDNRLANSLNRDQVHLFYRNKHHMPFTYFGEVFLGHAVINVGSNPSRFIFALSRPEAIAISGIASEEIARGDVEEEFVPDPEGRRKIRQHVIYERSRKNRAKAIEIHGLSCKACNFNFSAFYGSELAREYIEIHHTKSIAEINGPVNPQTDLFPLCSNCHSMVHRRAIGIMPIDELKEHIIFASQRVSEEGI